MTEVSVGLISNFFEKMLRRRSSKKYYSNRGNKPRSRRIFNNKLHTVKNLVVKMSVVVLFGGMIYAILFSSALTIKNVIIEGNKTIDSGEVEEIITSLASQKILKIFNNNLLFIDSVDMESVIKSRFSGIDTIKIEKKFPKTVKVIIKEKPADISWCNRIGVEKITDEKNISEEEMLTSDISQCYLSDEEGIIYEKIGEKVSNDSVKVFRDEQIAIGDKISDENLKDFIRKIFYDFNAKTGMDLVYLYLLPLESREIHLTTKENWKIYFDLNRSADEQLSVLNAFIKKELKENDQENIDYDYIDLRVIDRVYYKAKN